MSSIPGEVSPDQVKNGSENSVAEWLCHTILLFLLLFSSLMMFSSAFTKRLEC
jgi:hypothetical protein